MFIQTENTEIQALSVCLVFFRNINNFEPLVNISGVKTEQIQGDLRITTLWYNLEFSLSNVLTYPLSNPFCPIFFPMSPTITPGIGRRVFVSRSCREVKQNISVMGRWKLLAELFKGWKYSQLVCTMLLMIKRYLCFFKAHNPG